VTGFQLASRRALCTLACAIAFAVACDGSADTVIEPPQPSPPVVTLPTYDGTLLAAARLATLTDGDRVVWSAYVERSRKAMYDDQMLVQAELKARGLSAVIRPPNTASDFTVQKTWTPAFVATAEGKSLVASVLSYQTSSGGWGKHIDYSKGVRAPGTGYYSEGDDWSYVGTIDNGATVSELRLLGVAASAGDDVARTALAKGVRYLLNAQFPSGCWPQVWPLMGGYHDAETHNDNAMVGVVRLMRDVGNGTVPAVDGALRTLAAAAVTSWYRCVLAEQVVVRGVRTTWGQQHDPLTQLPVVGRSYELPSQAGKEGAAVLDVIMEEPAPSAALVTAAYGAATFYRATTITNMSYVSGTGLVPSNGASPLWARMMEIGTNRPIFSNRDGVLLYDFNQLTDRRTGYSWYSGEPAATLRTFDVWSRTHPSPPAALR